MDYAKLLEQLPKATCTTKSDAWMVLRISEGDKDGAEYLEFFTSDYESLDALCKDIFGENPKDVHYDVKSGQVKGVSTDCYEIEIMRGYTCSYCASVVSYDEVDFDSYTFDEGIICTDCSEECENCGSLFHPDEVKGGLCENCRNEEDFDD